MKSLFNNSFNHIIHFLFSIFSKTLEVLKETQLKLRNYEGECIRLKESLSKVEFIRNFFFLFFLFT